MSFPCPWISWKQTISRAVASANLMAVIFYVFRGTAFGIDQENEEANDASVLERSTIYTKEHCILAAQEKLYTLVGRVIYIIAS